MPSAPAALPHALGAAFSVPKARAEGVSRARLRAGDLETPHRGVRVRRAGAEASLAATSWERDAAARTQVLRRVDAYEQVRRPQAFYTGRTAVAIYDRLFDEMPGDLALDVAVFAPARAPRMTGVRGRQVRPGYASVRDVGGLPVASPASVWAGLGAELCVRDLVRLGDAFVRVPRAERGRQQPALQCATIEQLRAAAAIPRRPGRARLAEAVELVRPGSMSPLETDFRLDAHGAGLPEPTLDVEIRDSAGRLLGIADAVYEPYRVLVEVEGQHHLTSIRQWDRDIEKHAAFAREGFDVVRLTGRMVRAGQSAQKVGEALRRRGWTG